MNSFPQSNTKMCGITGAVSLQNRLVDEKTVSLMSQRIFHRGPDSGGVWCDPTRKVCLGHRRLAIIDISDTASQPMVLDNGNLVIVFNGEIYNFKELRRELENLGCIFKSSSDTEVVLRAYQYFGFECIERFNGMWAFAIFDKSRKEVFLSRDRFGMKPLYIYKKNGILFFASEVKAIIASGYYSPEVDFNGLNEYFTFQNIISNRTLFKDISMLPSGHNIIVSLLDGRATEYQYWDMTYSPDQKLPEVEIEKMLMKGFNNSIDRHLISDVEIGTTLSGGMDSSAILAIASQYINRINTFTGYFDTSDITIDDRSVSEKDDARIISQFFSSKHHERKITPQDVISTLPAIVWHLEDPKVGMCYTFYLMSQLVSNYVTVNLSGTGGDELFAGYPWRYSLIEDKSDPLSFDEIYFRWWNRLRSQPDSADFFTDPIKRQINPDDPFVQYRKVIEPADGYSPINRALYFDLKTFLHGFLLVEDKMGMAFSIETRFPFLDLELVSILQKIPDHLKFRNGISKYILKKAFSKLLPESILHKRKQGFTPPDRTWYQRELKDYIHCTLLGKRSILGNYISVDFIEKTLDLHNAGDDKRLIIWSFLFFEGWCRVFLTGSNGDNMRVF